MEVLIAAVSQGIPFCLSRSSFYILDSPHLPVGVQRRPAVLCREEALRDFAILPGEVQHLGDPANGLHCGPASFSKRGRVLFAGRSEDETRT